MNNIRSISDKWVAVSIAPSDIDLEICVMEGHTIHALVFPVRKDGTKWVDDSTMERVDVQPTHWREWIHNR